MNVIGEIRSKTPLQQTVGSGPITIIEPSHGWVALRLKLLWKYRELLYFLVWRDVKVRYTQTVLGVAWVVLQPLAATFIFTVIFGNLVRMPSDNIPYAIFAMTGLVPWNYFAAALSRGGGSLVGNTQLISKVYFPRLVIPIAAVLGGLVDVALVLALVFGLTLSYGVGPSPMSVTLPFFLLLAIAAALAMTLWLAALNVQYRDVGYLIPFLVQFWLFATPVVYPASLIPERWRLLYSLNPMVGVIEGFRWALLGGGPAPWQSVAIAVIVVSVLLVSGLFFFRRMEKIFADVV